jgi:hypothetical protein
MANYLLTYHGGGGMADTEEARAQVMETWGKWFASLGPAIVDGGRPVGQARTIAKDGAVTDGGGANPVSGYSILKADSLDAAVALARGCPVLAGGGSVEVSETFDVM